MRAFPLFCAALLTPFLSCSLMGLDDFDQKPCVDDADCTAVSNRIPPAPGQCAAYHCRDKLCVLEEGRETCNYRDDDCDGLIDEDVAIDAHEIGGDDSSGISVAYSADSPDGTTYVAIPQSDRGWILGKDALRYNSADADNQKTCPIPDGHSTCDFAELALAADTEHLVFVTINTHGCAAGQVRVGLSERQGEPYTVWLGTASDAPVPRASNIEFGVDVGTRGCTGASRESTSASGEIASGATSPAVAALGLQPGEDGALAVWLAAPTTTDVGDACTQPVSIPVEALGVFVPARESGWLNGTDDGKPRTLGLTTSPTPPAVIAANVEGTRPGYFVAFAEEQGVRLLFARVEEARLQYEDVLLIPETSVGQVALSLGRAQSRSTELAIAWSAGCGDQRALRFAIVRPFRETTFDGRAITVLAPGLRGRPQLLYDAESFAVAEPGGGWFLLWVEAASTGAADVRLARFTERTPRLISSVTLASGAFRYPLLYPVESSSSYALVGGNEVPSEIESYPGWCNDTN